MPNLGTMVVNFTANLSGLTAGTAAAKANLAQVASGGALVGGALLGVGVAAGAAGVQAVKMAGDFQEGVQGLVLGAGEAQKNVKMISDGILNLATVTGTSTKELTDGMFDIESAGFHGAAGLQVLEAASKGAKVGGADLATTTNALTTIMTDYHLKGGQAASATNAMMSAAASGKMTLQDLAGSMGTVLPIASSLGISFPQVGAAISVMTNSGMSADESTQHLANTIRSLAAPNAVAEKSMLSIGLTAQQVKDTLSTQGLTGTIELIEDHVGKKFPAGSVASVQAFRDIMGGATGYSTALMLGGKNMESFKTNVDSISKSLNTGGSSIEGWSTVQQNFNFKMSQAKEVIETTGIKIGTALMPAVTQLSNAFTFLVGVGANVANFFNHNQVAMAILVPVVTVLAGVLGGILVAALVVATIAAWGLAAAFLANPITLVAMAIGAAVAVIILAVQHWGQIVAWLQGVWSAFAGWFMGILGGLGAWFSGLWAGIIGGLKAAWAGVTGFFAGLWAGITGGIQAAWAGVAGFFTGLWNGIVNGIRNNWNLIVNIVKIGIATVLIVLMAPIIAIAAAFIWLYNHNYYFKALVDNIINFFRNLFTWAVAAWNGFVAGLAATWQGLVSTATTLWNAITTAISVTVNSVVNAVKVAWQVAISVLTALWNGLVGIASAAWNAVSGAIRTAFNAAIGFVQWIWGQISAIFSSAWGTYISGPLTSLWTNVSSVFSSAWGTYISGPINSLWDSLSTTISGWATKAFDWGKNLIQGIIDGIKSMASAAGDAAAGIVHNIGSFLGFHSPTEEGPGQDADKWAPAFVSMYTAGLLAGVPQVQAAMSKLMAPIEMNASSSSIAYPKQSNSSAAILAAVAAGGTATSRGQSEQPPIHIYIDGQEVTSKLGPHIADAIRAKGVRR